MTKNNEKLANYISSLNVAIDARKSNEEKNVNKATSFFEKLAKHRESVTHDAVASVMLASNVDVNYINTKNCSNIYTAKKVETIARTIASAASLDIHTLNVFKSAFALTKASKSMTHNDAKASICSNIKSSSSDKQALLSISAKFYDSSTANAQSSSSISALLIFNMLRKTRDERNDEAFTIDFENAAVKKLCKVLDLKI